MSHPYGVHVIDGSLCRAARALLGLSQTELCTSAGCGRKLLNDFENGLVHPKPGKVEAIRTALENAGAVFVRLNDMMLVGAAPGAGGTRSARARGFADGQGVGSNGLPGEPSGVSDQP